MKDGVIDATELQDLLTMSLHEGAPLGHCYILHSVNYCAVFTFEIHKHCRLRVEPP